MMLGGDNILISGPCYNSSQHIVCEFPGGKLNNGTYISDIRASCTVPVLNVTGRLPMKMSVNGGRSFDFQGTISIGNNTSGKASLIKSENLKIESLVLLL